MTNSYHLWIIPLVDTSPAHPLQTKPTRSRNTIVLFSEVASARLKRADAHTRTVATPGQDGFPRSQHYVNTYTARHADGMCTIMHMTQCKWSSYASSDCCNWSLSAQDIDLIWYARIGVELKRIESLHEDPASYKSVQKDILCCDGQESYNPAVFVFVQHYSKFFFHGKTWMSFVLQRAWSQLPSPASYNPYRAGLSLDLLCQAAVGSRVNV